MKKMLFLLAFSAFLLASCSADESHDPISSTITINGVAFKPEVSGSDEPAAAMYYNASANGGQSQSRSFVLNRIQPNVINDESLSFSIVYPLSQSGFEGTYDLANQSDPNAMAYCLFWIGTTSFLAESGSVTVTSLGGHKYRLKFDDVVAPGALPEYSKTINGIAQGTFTEQP